MIKNNYEAIILCGGLGTRFRSISETIPKTLAIVSGKPILKWLIDDLTSIGIKKIILATGYLSEEVENFIKQNNLNNCIISSENKPLGTGGAIKNAEKFIKKNTFFVLNGDSRIKYDLFKLLNFHTNNNSDMSVLLSSSTQGNDFGKVEISENNKINGFLEKKPLNGSSYINSGVYCMNKSLLSEVTKDKTYSLEKELLPLWVKEKKIFGHIVNLPFTDIGTKKRYLEANFD